MAPFKANAAAVAQADSNTNTNVKVEPPPNSPQPQNKVTIKSEDDHKADEVDPSDATAERDIFYQSEVAKLMKMREQRLETDQMFGEVMKGMEENEDKMMDMLNKFNEYNQKLGAEKAAKKAEEEGEGGVKRAISIILNEKFLTEDGKGAMFQLVMRDDRFRETYLRLPQEAAREGFRREVVRAKLVALGHDFEGIFKDGDA